MRKIMRVLGFSLLATTLHIGSAFAFAPESCSTDPFNANRCDEFDQNRPCYRPGDSPGQASGVCAALNGCSCVDPSPTGTGGVCSVAAPGGDAGLPILNVLPLGILGLSVIYRRFKRNHKTGN